MSDTTFDDLFITLQMNMLPVVVDALVERLGSAVTEEAIHRLGVGYYPAEEAWVFPERDSTGHVVGLLRRYKDGKKATWRGSKRGLIYGCELARCEGASFVRVGEAQVPCPICGRENDGCLVSDEDPSDPRAVICVRTPAGAVRHLPRAGYLHHRKDHTVTRGKAISILPASDKPVVITEGASDTLVAMSLGYVAIGLPQVGAVSEALIDLVKGRDVIIVGDRDTHGVGQKGMEIVFEHLYPVCKSVVKLLPPEPFKDLRAWSPTTEQFSDHVAAVGDSRHSQAMLGSDLPYDLVCEWINQTQMEGKDRLIQYVHGDFYRWEKCKYRPVSQAELRGWWYPWFSERKVSKILADGSVKVTGIKPDLRFMRDIEDAAKAICYVRVADNAHEPICLASGDSLDVTGAVVFQNGIYYVRSDSFCPITPDVFLTTTLPYDFDARAKCRLWEWFVMDIFRGEQDCIDLLQEWIGYCLVATNHMQSMMFLFGTSGSGKSTVGRVIEAVLGPERSCAVNTDSFRSLFGPSKLLNKYVAIMSESRDIHRADIDKLLQMWKAITGGDTISVPRKYRDAVDARLFCRLMYIANEVLPFDDTSQAMLGRTNLLYFPNNYRQSGPDRLLPHKLMREAPGIALWAINGLRRLLDNDKFTLPITSERHLQSIQQLTNPIGLMMNECCIQHVGPEYFQHVTRCNDLYDLWVAWCKATNTPNHMSRIGFGMRLATIPNPPVRKQKMIDGERFYVYEGLEIVPKAMSNYLGK